MKAAYLGATLHQAFGIHLLRFGGACAGGFTVGPLQAAPPWELEVGVGCVDRLLIDIVDKTQKEYIPYIHICSERRELVPRLPRV